MNLEAKNISLHAGTKCLYQNLNLYLQPGEIWGILGPNGCGKSTLLHTLAGLSPVSKGEILLQGENIRSLYARTIARSVAILFQQFNDSLTQTVWEYCKVSRYPHLSYFARMNKQDKEFIEQTLFSMELGQQIHQSIHTLSGGEKQRLALAAVLIQKPRIYLLDEPINHLDVRHQLRVLKILSQLASQQQASVCMSLHDINLAQQFCHRLLLLYPDGTFLAGTTKEMCTKTNLTQLYGHPIKEMTAGDSIWWFEL